MRNNTPSLPVVEGTTLSYLHNGHAARLAIGTLAWYTWLESATSFAYRGPFGSFTARKERAGNRRGECYWRAYCKRGGKLHRAYLGRAAALTSDRLDAAAAKLASQREREEEGAGGEPKLGEKGSVVKNAAPGSHDYRKSPTVATDPPLKEHSSPSRPSLLPVQLTSFVGREHELETISALLLDDDLHLLTLTGPGGVGKTRLALHMAAQLRERFAYGIFFVNLAPVRDPVLVVSAIAQTLGVTESPGQSLIGDLQAHLRDREVLLVLDNFEHVMAATPTVTELLVSCPRLKVLATSREVLRLSGEHVFPVPPLAVPLAYPAPQHRLEVEQLTQYAAVRLFIQRARAVQLDFTMTTTSAAIVSAICVRLDGLPLAIELVAARVRLFSPEAILARLAPGGGYLRLLVGGARDLPARQQTLHSTIEWSYDLLDEAEKLLFRRMSVFAGGCTLEAIEAVTGMRNDADPGNSAHWAFPFSQSVDVLDGVSSLVDKSLLRKEDGFGGDARRVPGFVLLETIREYAAEKLQESGETDEIRRRHALYFLTMVEEAEPELRGAHQTILLDRLEAEHDNVRAALAWSLDATRSSVGTHPGDDADTSRLHIGLRIGGALLWFWDTRGHFTEGRANLAQLLSRSASLGPTSSRAKALMTAGRLAWAQGDLEEAHSLYEESLAIFRLLDDKLYITYALNGLANTVKLHGDYDAAASFLEQSLAVARELADKERIGAALENLGEIALAQGDYSKARDIHEEGLRLFRECDDKHGIGLSLQDLGIVALRQGDYARARGLLEEAFALYREIGEKRFSVVVLYELGQVARGQGDDTRAATLFKESLRAAQGLSDRIFVGLDLGGLAAVASGEGMPERAARLFGAADAIIGITGYRWFQADRATFERSQAAAYAELGKERWQTAVEEGRTMSLDAAVTYALESAHAPRHAFFADMTAEIATAGTHKTAGVASTLQQLTQREAEVLRLVAAGLTAPQVAERMYLSVRTVENHLRSIYGKLDVSTRAAATRIAVEHGLLKD